MSLDRNYVAILSSGRSGSTLLTNLIDGVNDRIYVHPVEINFASAFNDLGKLKKISYKTKYYAKFDKIIFLKRVKKKDLVNYYNGQLYQLKSNFLDQTNEFKQKLELINLDEKLSKEDYSLEEFIKIFFDIIIMWIYPNQKKDTIVFKTLDVSHGEILENNIKNLKFIHNLRDPIKMYESLLRAPRIDKNIPLAPWFLAGDNLSTMINRWKNHTKYILLNKKKETMHITVKYEDILLSSSDVINKIFKFINVEIIKLDNSITILGGNTPLKMIHNIGLPENHVKKFNLTLQKSMPHQKINILFSEERKIIIYALKDLAIKFNYFDNIELIKTSNLFSSWFFIKPWEIRYISNFFNYNNSIKYSSFTKILLTLFGVLRAIKGIALRRYNILKYILDY
tara:strand:- start:2897 stop:4084 length:1188 start_codon:yes stop_codon:yes gene_type:complete